MASARCHAGKMVAAKSTQYKNEFTWKLDNWQEWWSSMEANEIILSETFKLEAEGVVHEFKLAMLKYNSYESIIDSIEIILRLSLYYLGPSDFIILKPSFYIPLLGRSSGHTFPASRLKKSGFSHAWIWSEHWFIVNRDDILVDGSLTFACLAQMFIFKRDGGLSLLENNLPHKKTWNQCFSEEFEFISGTKNTKGQLFSDFEIRCKDEAGVEKSFYCHKLVLSLRSEYFKTMLSGYYNESQGWVDVPDISIGSMAKMLQYFYTGELDPRNIDIDLFSTAHKYQAKDLQAICERELAAKISMDNAPKLAYSADLFGSNAFKKYVFRFVAKYWKQMKVKGRNEWLENNPALLAQILNAV